MRIMAAPAVHDGRVDIDVGFLERVCLLVMALSAEGLDGLDQQPLFRRPMRFVARQAIPGCGRVHGFLAHPLLHALVTGKAYVGGICQQQFAEFRLMGTMALRAETVLYRLMPAFRRTKHFSYTGMALEAKCSLILDEHPVIGARMRVVAIEAQTALERRVDGIVLDLFHKITVALHTDFCSRGFNQLPLIRSMDSVT